MYAIEFETVIKNKFIELQNADPGLYFGKK